MPTAEISETVANRREMAPSDGSPPLAETETREDAWERRFNGILAGTLPPLTDEEIIEVADRRYEEIQSGKAKVLTLEEHWLATR